MGRGEEGPLYDPGPELHYWEGESSASKITGMGKKKSEVKWPYYCCCNNTIPKQVAPTRSGLLHNAIGPCTTFLITGQDGIIVIELAELLSEW